ncbi:CheR family methyltransferase [Rhizobium sp. AN95]|uniref:CheR family methyltransferase n=1 Tax=Rhizobium sp. AN95 TaxID=3035216 RepID=UPI002B25BCD3|nr:CheR family methyltransferase [Rhizobium sp. AN95]
MRVSTANDFSAYKHGTLQRRVEKRIAVLGIEIEEIDRYLEMLENSEEERQNLVRDLLINVTSFFRDGKVFDFLRDTIIPDILHAKAAHGAVRVWVAGCSTGEEAYSLAILFLEAHSVHGPSSPVSDVCLGRRWRGGRNCQRRTLFT